MFSGAFRDTPCCSAKRWRSKTLLGERIMQSIICAHLTAFLFLLPFMVMLTIHRMLGLSDNLNVEPAPGEPDSSTYNWFMSAAFYGGVGGFVWHVLAIARPIPPLDRCETPNPRFSLGHSVVVVLIVT